MKTAKLIFPIVFAIVLTIAFQSCKKNQCYECIKNAGQVEESKWNMCDQEDHDNAVAAGYTCHEVDK